MLYNSYAKINLSLKNLGIKEDGYHELDMVELPLEFHDIIEIEKLPVDSDSYVTCSDLRVARFKDNLCKLALDEMRKEFGFKENFDIHCYKEIPFKAGLGGGSSNAATVILAINDLLHLKAPKEKLVEIALRLGADVPFFLDNKPSRVSGIGDKIEHLKVDNHYEVLIIKPERGLSTKEVYSICDDFDKLNINTEKVIEGLLTGNEAEIAENFGNDLLAPGVSLAPEIGEYIKELKAFGFPIVSMSGSGSCVFAMSKNTKAIKEAYKKLLRKGYNVYASKILR